MSGSAPRTLADQLRGWPDERLAALLEARPDLGVPPPQDSAQLASRAVVRASVRRALDELDTLQLAVLEAAAYEGPAATERLHAVVNATAEAVDEALHAVVTRALVWGEESAWRAVTVAAEEVTVPGGASAATVPALLAELDPQARAILDHLDRTGADGEVARGSLDRRPTRASAGTPTEQLVARGLLVPRDDRHVTLPWGVRLALREGRSTRERVDVEPALAVSGSSTERDPALIERTAAGSAFELVRRTELLLDRWGTHPPSALRSGGLGVRDLRATAALLHLDEPSTALIVETAAAAGLLGLGMTDTADAAWLPTDAFDAWLREDTAHRWAALARAWLASPRLATGTAGVNALSAELDRPWAPRLRRDVLTAVGTIGAGRTLAAATGRPSLVARLRWHRPRRAALPGEVASTVLEEAAVLGMLGLDGPTRAGERVLRGEDPTGVLTPLLPATVDHVLLQADLTAIAPGPLEGELAQRLALVADVESGGGATVYRFTADSVRRALDAGWPAAEVHAFVASVSRTPVPQALEFLVDDVARRFGAVRVGHATGFVRSDDPAALAELVHRPEAASLRLRALAPTVLVSDVPLDVLLPRLRELGVAPVVEAADGTVRVARPDVFRARRPRPQAPARDDAREAARRASVVTAVRAGDRVEATRPRSGPATSPAEVTSLLRQAADAGDRVLIGYVGNDGSVAERLVLPQRVEGGRLTAHDERADGVLTFALHRITAAAVARQTT